MQVVIARSWLTRYSHRYTQEAGGMASEQERAELERRLDAGEWLLPGEVAKVLGVSRSTATRMVKNGEIAYRLKPGSRYRTANPADVKRLLDESRQEHRATGSTPAAD